MINQSPGPLGTWLIDFTWPYYPLHEKLDSLKSLLRRRPRPPRADNCEVRANNVKSAEVGISQSKISE